MRTGLTARPKRLPPRWLYDPTGCALFEEITELPEYYPTRAEREILTAYGAEIAARCGASTLIELGSGTSDKTIALIDALRDAGTLRRFIAFDVAEPTLRTRRGRAWPRRTRPSRSRASSGTSALHLDRLPTPTAAWSPSSAAPSAT